MSNPSSHEYDFIVVGQGIAGTTLAWHLHWLGKHVLIVDRGDAMTSSRVAAGLITPLVGEKLAVSWRFDELWPIAKSFYERVERETESEFFSCAPMVRLFVDEHERDRFSQRSTMPRPSGEGVARTHVDLQWFNAAYGALAMEPAGRIDVPRYLDVSRDAFRREGCFRQVEIDPVDGVKLHSIDGVAVVSLPTLNITATHLVFCQGIEATTNARFHHLAFEPAKGEMLTLYIPGLPEQRVVHQGIWLAPMGDDLFLAGATFERDVRCTTPSAAGREEILLKLRRFLHVTPEIRNHTAGVRPIVKGRLPVIGGHDQLSFFNGLGSKGALRAPFTAGQLANFLVNGSAVDAELLPKPKKLNGATTPRRLTAQAQRHASNSLRHGDIAIDATAGNGIDTLFLARTVGVDGRVFAFDIQRDAIDRTRSRLESEAIRNVELVQASHANLESWIPKEYHGRVSVAMFNLGYLPGGDKSLITKAKSTTAAIESSLSLLVGGGVVTIVAYTGHDGGYVETQCVEKLLGQLDHQRFAVQFPAFPLDRKHPRLYVVTRIPNTDR